MLKASALEAQTPSVGLPVRADLTNGGHDRFRVGRTAVTEALSCVNNPLSACLDSGLPRFSVSERLLIDINGEFDPGSGRTLAACLTHASRAERPFGVLERRTGE